MADTYTVREVVSKDEYDFPGDEGQVFIASWELKVDGPQSNGFDPVTQTIWQDRQKSSDMPQPGEEIFADVKKVRDKYKLKRTAKRDRDRTPMDSGSKAGYRQQDPPEVVARIGRAHAQQMAVELVSAAEDSKGLDLSNKQLADDYLTKVVRPLVDWFAEDVDLAGRAADAADKQAAL